MRSRDRVVAAMTLWLAATAAHAGVEVRNAWIRAMAPGQKTAAAYFTARSDEDARIVAATSSVAGRAQLHASMITSGVAHMHELDGLKLPAGKSVELKPGGDHLMLMDVTHALKAGEQVPLVLTVEDARGQRTTVEVKARVTPIAE